MLKTEAGKTHKWHNRVRRVSLGDFWGLYRVFLFVAVMETFFRISPNQSELSDEHGLAVSGPHADLRNIKTGT